MRVHASLGALAAVGLLGRSVAAPPPTPDPYGAEICTPTATTTVFVTVPDTNPASVPGDGGLQTATVTVPDSGAPGGPDGPGASAPPGFPGSQTSVSATFTLTLTDYPAGSGQTPYSGPRPWETRSTVATRTVTAFPNPQPPAPTGSDGSGSPPGSGDGPGAPGSPSGDGTPGQPGHGTPGQPGDGTPGQPGDDSPDQPGHGTPGGPGSPKDDCVTVITTTLYHTGPVPSQGGEPTIDTVVATFTVTYPDGPGETQGPGTPDHGDHGHGTPHTTVITRTVYQPTLAPGQPTVSRDVVVETVTVQVSDPDGSFPPGITPGPVDDGPVSVFTTTLYHPRTVDGDGVTFDSVVATFTVTFPPPSATGPGGPGGPGAGDSLTFIPTTWYETTVCPDPFGNLAPTIRTHVSTIASVLPHQPSPTGVPGSGGPDSGPESPGGPGGPGGPNGGDFVTVITETVYHPSPAPGAPADSTPSFDVVVATITATFPHGPASGLPDPDGTSGPQGPGDLISVVTTTIYVPIATAGPSDPKPSGPGGDGLPGEGGIVQTFTVTVPHPSPAPGDHITGAPPAPTSAPDHGSGDVGPVIITTLFHTTTHIGPDGKPTVGVDTFTATFTATTPSSGISDVGPAPTGPHDGTEPYVTIITSTVTPISASPDPYGTPGGAGQPGASGAPGAPGSPSGPGGPGGPVGPDGSAPTVIVFTSTIYPPSGTATGPAYPGGPGVPPQQTDTDDGPVTVLSATFTLTAPPGPGETGPGDVQTVTQSFTYTFPSDPTDGSDGPGGQPSATGPPAGTGVPTLGGAPDAYGSAVNTGSVLPVPPTDPDADISGVIHLTSTGTITQTAPAGYGDGASGIPTDGLFPPPSQSGGVSILPIPNLPSEVPAPGGPSDPSHSSVSGQLPFPGQPSGQPQIPPSKPSITGHPSVPGDGSVPDQTFPPGQVTDPAKPTVSGAPGDATSKTTCTTDLVPGGAGSPAPGDGSSGISPVVVPPQQTTEDSLGSLPTDGFPDGFPDSYGFPTFGGPVPAGPSAGAPPVVSDSGIQTSGALPTLIDPPSPDGDGSGLSSKDCTTGLKTLVVSAVQTSTFFNIIPQATTTYTFPYEALVTVHSTVVTENHVPTLRKWFKRQEEDVILTSAVFANTTSPAPTSGTGEPTEITLFPTATLGNATTLVTGSTLPTSSVDTSAVVEAGTPVISVQLPICTGAAEVGNQVLTFDTLPDGPLYNPYERIWFSHGFSVAPPPSTPFVPSSGGKLLKFDPPVVHNSILDTAQFGVGIDAASDCFRFNFHGANLGCNAGQEGQFCEFTFTGYRFNATLNAEEEAMSQLAWVPACSAVNECLLTPFFVKEFDDITSVLVTLRVDGEPSPWFADEVRFGWYNNSCEAGRCRAGTPRYTSQRRLVVLE